MSMPLEVSLTLSYTDQPTLTKKRAPDHRKKSSKTYPTVFIRIIGLVEESHVLQSVLYVVGIQLIEVDILSRRRRQIIGTRNAVSVHGRFVHHSKALTGVVYKISGKKGQSMYNNRVLSEHKMQQFQS